MINHLTEQCLHFLGWKGVILYEFNLLEAMIYVVIDRQEPDVEM